MRWQPEAGQVSARLNHILIDRVAPNEPSGYPTLCKGRFDINGDVFYALEEPTSLNTLEVLPQLLAMGIAAIKVEGRQRSPVYTAQVTHVLRQALDAAAGAHYAVAPQWAATLADLSEGHQQTLGAYHRPWR